MVRAVEGARRWPEMIEGQGTEGQARAGPERPPAEARPNQQQLKAEAEECREKPRGAEGSREEPKGKRTQQPAAKKRGARRGQEAGAGSQPQPAQEASDGFDGR